MAVMLPSWDSNRRLGISLAVRHRLTGRANYGLRGDEHSTFTARASGLKNGLSTKVLSRKKWRRKPSGKQLTPVHLEMTLEMEAVSF